MSIFAQRALLRTRLEAPGEVDGMQEAKAMQEADATKVERQLGFVQRWYCAHLYGQEKVDQLLRTFCWEQTARALEGVREAQLDKAFRLGAAYTEDRYAPLLLGRKFTYVAPWPHIGEVQKPGSLVLQNRRWVRPVRAAAERHFSCCGFSREQHRRLRHLRAAWELLVQARAFVREGTGGVLRCTRASSYAVLVNLQQSARWQRVVELDQQVFVQSVSNGAGLVEHLPFLRLLVGHSKVQFQSLERLGRRAWFGAALVLRECGIKVVFSSRRESLCFWSERREVAREEFFTGCVIVPSWLGVGFRLGKVCVVPPASAAGVRVAYEVAPGFNIHGEHLLLLWALRGVRWPVRLVAPVAGNSCRRACF